MLIQTQERGKTIKLTYVLQENVRLIVDIDLEVFSFMLVVDDYNYYDVNNFVEKAHQQEMQETIEYLMSNNKIYQLTLLLSGFAHFVYNQYEEYFIVCVYKVNEHTTSYNVYDIDSQDILTLFVDSKNKLTRLEIDGNIVDKHSISGYEMYNSIYWAIKSGEEAIKKTLKLFAKEYVGKMSK